MYQIACIISLLLGVGHGTGTPGTERIECPSCCRWEDDGRFWRIDCVDLGLRDIPSNLSSFTSYLDLSMNNLSALPAHTFSQLHFLQELRLAGNGLTSKDVPKDVFTGLLNLKVLMLQNNHLKRVPSEALQSLRNLLSLRLDANLIALLPPTSFKGLVSLRHLWLDDNSLTQVPVHALASLPALQAVTFALNRITSIPDKAFDNLNQLVVLDLHNNQIRSLGKRCFDGLHNLETLDLNCNRLDTFPTAIRALPNLRELNLHSNNIKSIPEHAFIGNPSLETINLHNNPIQFVGRSAFQHLPELRTLSLNGASDITAFPDLTGTNRLETLTITGTSISSVPSAICEHLPNLQKLDLSHNLIQSLPSLRGCSEIQRIDLSFNWLSSFSVEGLQGLTHLRLAGNLELRETIPLHELPRLRVAEMPFAFQCCVFVSSCDKPKCPYRWTPGGVDNISKHSLTQLETYCVTSDHVDHVPEDLVVDLGVKARPQLAVHCYPIPSPFQSCQSSLGSWLVHFGVWIIFILSIVFNSLALVSIFLSTTSKTPTHHTLSALFWVHLLTGLSTTFLAVVDTKTMDHCGAYDLWGRGPAPRVTDFLFILSSEVCLFLMVAVVFERRHSIYNFNCTKVRESVLGRGGVRGISAICCTLAIAALPLLIVGEYLSSQCVAFSNRHAICLGYNTALVVLNFLCYLFMTVTHNVPRNHKEKVMVTARSGCAVTKTVTFLLLTNCLIFFSVAFIFFSSLFQLPSLHSQEITRSTMLLLMALPTCLDPLLYMVLSPQFREELCTLLRSTSFRLKREHKAGLKSVTSEDAEEQPCKSMQGLVSISL